MHATKVIAAIAATCSSLFAARSDAAPQFVNGVVIPGNRLDATEQPGANRGRLGFFSDLYYDPERKEWWAISDRGPGGGVIDYATRVQRLEIKLNKTTGAIQKVDIEKTITFTDPLGILTSPVNPGVAEPRALNGLNPLQLNGDVGVLGRSFDPEGIVVDPRTGHLIVADEYGPSVYVFDRRGRLRKVFETPENLVPKIGTAPNYVADRGGGLDAGRQDNRGFEGLAITPDGERLVGVLQDPLVNEPGPNNGRNGRNVRIVVFDNDRRSANYTKSIAQYVYQLELQQAILDRIEDDGQVVDPDALRQGRNIGLSAIVAINQTEFLVLERDNRGIGVEDATGSTLVGSKRVYKIDISGATDVTNELLPADVLPANVIAVSKSTVFIDLAANTVLPNGKIAEKWEGLAIGPGLRNGARAILAGNDNDYSVTQSGPGTQFDVYVNFTGGTEQRDLDQPTRFNGIEVGPVPTGYSLLPGVLHAYRVLPSDLPAYVPPNGDDDCTLALNRPSK